MNEEHHNQAIDQIKDHRLIVLVVMSIVAATALVAVALSLYATSGAAQLDLSRPGYEAIRTQAQEDNSYKGFASDGELDDEALAEFDTLYSEKLRELQSVDAFGGNVISTKSLQIDQTSTESQAR